MNQQHRGRWRRFVSLCLAAWLLTGAAAAGECAIQPETRVALENTLHNLFQDYDTLGASVAVFQNGQVTYTYCYGNRFVEGTPVTSDSLFQCGSISKMVANMGLMQLLYEQDIPLDTPVEEVLGFPVRHPDYPDLPITLRQVMSHTAGLQDGRAYRAALEGNGMPLHALLDGNPDSYLAGAKPGETYHYSNLGGGLIGPLVEALSGQTLDSYMQEHVFQPLGITAAYQAGLLSKTAPVCDLYFMPSGQISKSLRVERDQMTVDTAPDPDSHYDLSAGKLIISAPDLCKLLIVLCDGGIYEDVQLLPSKAAKEMRTCQDGRWSVSGNSGRGLFVNIQRGDQVPGRTLYGHGGKAHGMLCAAYFDPTDRTGVVMLTNGCDNRTGDTGVGELGSKVLTAVYECWLNQEHEKVDAFYVE